MDKIKLNTLGLPLMPPTQLELAAADGSALTITIQPRIPTEQIFDMITWCVNLIIDDRTFISAPVQAILTDIAIIKYYTNIDCGAFDESPSTEKMYEFYDFIDANDLMPKLLCCISPKQLEFFKTTLEQTLHSIVAYRNSAKGIVDVLSDAAKIDNAAMDRALSYMDDPEKKEQINKLLNFYAEANNQ